MIFKGTYLIPMDKNGVWWVSTFHLYGGFNRKYCKTGGFLKVSVKNLNNDKWLKKKSKIVGISILTKKEIPNLDGTLKKFKMNTIVLLKKRLSSVGKEMVGPCPKNISRKRFLYSFSGII